MKYVTLEILEMSKDEAQKSLNDSESILQKMNASGFYLNDVQKILDSMQTDYSNLQFNALRDFRFGAIPECKEWRRGRDSNSGLR